MQRTNKKRVFKWKIHWKNYKKRSSLTSFSRKLFLSPKEKLLQRNGIVYLNVETTVPIVVVPKMFSLVLTHSASSITGNRGVKTLPGQFRVQFYFTFLIGKSRNFDDQRRKLDFFFF